MKILRLRIQHTQNQSSLDIRLVSDTAAVAL